MPDQPSLLDVPPIDLEPVVIQVERDHPFKKKDPDPATGKRRVGCATCAERGLGIVAKLNVAHLGAPPSMNEGGSGMDRMEYQAVKGAWMAALSAALVASPANAWPRPLHAVMVEAQIGFSTRQSRDEGNLRWMIEKALGDALKKGGWLEDDCFYPVRRYSFGSMEGVHSPGRSFTRLILFPSAAAVR